MKAAKRRRPFYRLTDVDIAAITDAAITTVRGKRLSPLFGVVEGQYAVYKNVDLSKFA